jgi:hypothetical protein
MKKITTIIFVLTSFLSFSGNEKRNDGSRAASMGFTGVSISDFWSVTNNQAGLAYIENLSIGLYTENKFLLKELNRSAIAIVNPLNSGVIGLSLSYFGYNMYNEKKLGIAYSRKFSEMIAFGLQLDYFHTKLGDNYGSKSAVTFELGFIAKINKNLSIGGHIYNPIQAKFNDYNNEKIPSTIAIGLANKFSENILTTIEFEKSINTPLNLKTGIEYKITENYFARLGINTNPELLTFGFGFNYSSFTFDFSSNYHQILGYSPQMSVIYRF